MSEVKIRGFIEACSSYEQEMFLSLLVWAAKSNVVSLSFDPVKQEIFAITGVSSIQINATIEI